MRKSIFPRIGIAVLGLVAVDRPCRRPDGRQGRRPGGHKRLDDVGKAATKAKDQPCPSRSRGSSPGRSKRVRVYRISARPLVVAMSPCRNRSICSTSPIGSAGSSGCWRSWGSRCSCRTTAGRSRAGSSSGGWSCNGGLPCWSCACRPASDSSSEAGEVVKAILDCALEGAGFVFGKALVDPEGPAGLSSRSACLPTVIFVAALFAVLYHLGVMQWIVRGFAVVMAWLMGTSGAESLNVAASLFLGPDRGAADDPPVPAAADALGAADRHDLGHGPRLRRA